MDRFVKLFITLVVSVILIYVSYVLGNRTIFYNMPHIRFLTIFLEDIAHILFKLLYVIGLFFFFKVTYLWIKELWKLK